MANPLEAGIIGPTKAEATPFNELHGPIRKSRVFTGVAAVLGIPTSLALLSACSQQPAEVRTISTPELAKPTATPEPAHTPIAIGVSIPDDCRSNPDAVKGWDIATSKRPLTSADNPYIDAFNVCVATVNKQAEARMTAEAAKPTATLEPIRVPPTPTAELTKAPLVEVKTDEPCDILPQKYCSQADRLQYKNVWGSISTEIGIKKIPAGKPFTMPFDGQIAPTKLNSDVIFYKGNRVVIFNKSNPKRLYILTGDFQPIDMLTHDMKQGEVFGHATDTGIEMAGYSYIYYVADIGPDNHEINNDEEMRKSFSEAYNKIPIQETTPEIKSEESAKAGGKIYINTFSDNPDKPSK